MIRLAPLVFVALLLPTAPVLADTARTIIVMDGSGSMWGQIDGRAKLEIARETVAEVLGTLPAAQELGLMAYGHRRKGDCSDIELVVPPGPGTGPAILQTVNTMRFLGKTPLSQSVKQAAEALRYGEEAATVVLVTDGLETCEADPCALGRELEAAGLNFTAHVIGFGLTQAEGAQVACLATETGGRYIQASDAGSLSAALRETIVAAAPEPEPVPEPEPEPVPVLPQASLTAPESAPAGSVLEVGFEGPREEFDYIRILDANGDWQAEANAGEDPFVTIRLPFEPGPYEIVYLYQTAEIIARKPLTITEAVVSLTAPDTAPAGSLIDVQWTGPGAEYDYINLLDAAGERVAESYVGASSPVQVRLPFTTGAFTLTYLFQSSDVIFSRPITLTEAPVSITAPDTAQVGTDVTLAWVGPATDFDNIQFYRQSDDSRLGYQYLGDTDQLVFTMPEEPGMYEFRYVFLDQETIHVRPISVTLDKVEAAPVAPSTVTALTSDDLTPVTILADDSGMFHVIWSGVPVPGQDLPPEAWAVEEGVVGPVETAFFPGDYDILGDAGDQVFAGRITVSADGENRFVIPFDPNRSPSGPDDPANAPGDPVPIAISGVYGFGVTWRAIPLSGQDSDVLGDVAGPGAAWNTRLDPGLWRIVGQAEGAVGAVYAGDIQVSASGETTIVMPHFMVNPDFPSDGGYRCNGKPICGMTDLATGLGMILPDGYGTDMPLFAQTAGGVRADSPMVSVLDITGATDEVIAVLNPLQWLESNGTCTDTEAGSFCTFAGLTALQVERARVIGASITIGPPRDTPQTLRDAGILVTNPPENLFDLLAPDWKRN